MSGRKSDHSKADDLKNILMSFRIADLQTLLQGCGRSRSGRKHELLGRALNLLKNSDGSAMRERVKTRILEIHNQRYPQRQYQQQQPYVSQYNSEKDVEEPTYMNRSSTYKQHSSSSHHSSSSYNSQTSHSQHSQQQMAPSYNTTSATSNSYSSTVTTNMPVHPDVKFITLPFFRKLDELVKPTSLVQKTTRGYQDMHVVFHLTPYQTQLINNSRSYNLKSNMDYGVQIQLRFCLAEVSCVQEDSYPTRCKLVINGRGCTLPGQPPPNAQNQEPRKPHRPINITNFCRLSPSQSNQIHIQWIPSDMGQRWVTTISLVKTVPTESLIQQLKNKTERPNAHTIAFIQEKLRPDPDSEIALTSLKVSLCCPIGRTRMTMPCRAMNCNHLQCFDGSLYIQMNERKPSWVCPVCDQKAHYDSLFKDGMFLNILEQSPNCDEIMFFEDGSWRPAAEIEESSKPLSQVVQTPSRQSTSVDKSPPSPINIQTPPLVNLKRSPPPKMPDLERIGSTTPNSNDNDTNADDDDIEVICIDDSDEDDDDGDEPPEQKRPPSQPPPLTKAPLYPTHGSQPPALSGFADPELQGLDLYNILPYEDRIAAAMHLDQNNYCGNLIGGASSRNSSASIIDISDE